MTPKEKAQELLSKYTSITLKEVVPDIFLAFDEELCKKFALIAVDEMIAELAYVRTLDKEIDEKVDLEIDQRQDFLIEVEKEIKAL